MCELRPLVAAERSAQREDAVRRVEQVFTANHVRDAHVEVVDRVGQVEDRRRVAAHDDEVGDRRPVDGHLAPHQVVEPADTVVGRAEAHRHRPTLGPQRLPLTGGEVTRPAVVAGRELGRPPLGVHGFELLGGLEALVGEPGLEHRRRGLAVPVEAGALVDRLAVPVEAEPVEHVGDAVGPLWSGPRDVGVLDAQQELAALVTGEQEVEQRRAHPADVQRPRRRRREPDAHTRCIIALGHSGTLYGTRSHQRSLRRGGASRSRRAGSGSYPRRSG